MNGVYIKLISLGLQEEDTYGISINYSDTTNAVIEIMLDGAGHREGSPCLALDRAGFTVKLLPGLHGIRVKKINTGNFMLNSIEIAK